MYRSHGTASTALAISTPFFCAARQAELEARLADLASAQIAMLASLYPRHVLEHMSSCPPGAVQGGFGCGASATKLARTHQNVRAACMGALLRRYTFQRLAAVAGFGCVCAAFSDPLCLVCARCNFEFERILHLYEYEAVGLNPLPCLHCVMLCIAPQAAVVHMELIGEQMR